MVDKISSARTSSVVVGDLTKSTEYKVQKGDTLGQLAKKAGVSVQDIMAVNPGITNANFIRTGDIILIPIAGQKIQTTNAGTDAVDVSTDKVEPSKTTITTGGSDLERRVAELEKQLGEERSLRVEREKQEADELKKPSFKRTLMEIFDLFNRFFNPLWNVACALFRICRIGYNLIAGKPVDWKKEGTKLIAELGGAALQILLPGVGGFIGGALSAGVEGYMNWKHNESEIMGGVNKLTDKADVEYGIKRAALKVADVAKDAYNGAKRLIAGKDDAPAADDGVQPLTPADVEV